MSTPHKKPCATSAFGHFTRCGCPSAQLSLDGPERGGEGEGGRTARDGVTRDGESVDGVVGERGAGCDGEGDAVMVIGADPNGALFGGDGRVVRSGLDRLVEGSGEVLVIGTLMALLTGLTAATVSAVQGAAGVGVAVADDMRVDVPFVRFRLSKYVHGTVTD